MQASSINQHEEISKADLLRIAPFSKRQLAKVYREGYLPRPQRRSRAGSNKPVYFWDESVVEQATLLYDLLQLSQSDHWIRLALWLQGHEVDFAPIRQRWLDSIDVYLQAFTQGNADNPLDNITDVVSKWEHTPTNYRPEPLRRLGLGGYAQWAELFWDVLLIPELDEMMFAEVLAMLQMLNAAGDNTELQEEFAESFLHWLQTLQEVLAMPRLREAIEQATPEAWKQARMDYMTLSQFCQTLFAPATQAQSRWVNLLQFVGGGFYLVPAALAIRYRGYGHWIASAFALVNEQLADPDVQDWLVEQLTRRRPESPE